MTAGAVINCEPGFETTLLSASSASPRRTLICFWLQTRSGVAIATCSGLLYFRPLTRAFLFGSAKHCKVEKSCAAGAEYKSP